MTVRVLVVDDSALMRRAITDILGTDSDIVVVGWASDGLAALERIQSLSPDVILLDIEMPRLDGLSALRRIMRELPRPVIMLSAKADSSVTLDALAAGAVDFIAKPAGLAELDGLRLEILSKVKEAAHARPQEIAPAKAQHRLFAPTTRKVVVIGASTGGPPAVERVLRELPKNTPAPVLIVQHMPPGFTRSFADRLDKMCEMRVAEAKDGDELAEGVALIAPGGYHMEIAVGAGGKPVVSLNQEASELSVRPSANRLFRSAARLYEENTIGVVLTGMGSDGKDGSRAIKDVRGTVIAEAEESCTIFGMPREVIKAGLADEVVRIDQMAVAVLQLLDI